MTDLDYCKIVGRFALTVADGVDADDNPDTVYCDEGIVKFTPITTFAKVAGASPVPMTLGNAVIEAAIDSSGYLSRNGVRWVNLVDLGSDKVNPSIPAGKATYKVTFENVRASGTRVEFPEFTFRPLPGVDNDLTLLAPVPVAGGTAIVVGPKGTGVSGASITGPGHLQLALTDGTAVDAGALPVGPGGSDAGVATYIDTPGSATAASVAAKIESAVEDEGPVREAIEEIAESKAGATDSSMLAVAKNPSSVFALRAKAEIESKASAVLLSAELGFGSSAATSGSTSTWAGVTGSSFTFTAPASGQAQVDISLGYAMPSGVAELAMRLVDGATNPYPNSARRLVYQPASSLAVQGQAAYSTRLTGLTPGATITCVLSIINTASTAQPSIQNGTVFGPALVKVTSMPAPATSDTATLVRGTPETLKAWAVAKAAVAGGTRDAKVLLIGDSTQFGYLGNNPAKFLATLLAARGLAAQPGGTLPGLNAGAGINPRYTAGAGWPGSAGTNYGFGSHAWTYQDPAGALEYLDTEVSADSYDVYYLRGGGSTSITLQIDSETAQTFTTTGSTSIQKLSITSTTPGPSTSHRLKITAVGGGAIVFVEPWLSTAKKIRVANAGVPSTDTKTWVAGSGIYSRAAMAAYSPDVVFCLLGANDSIDPAGVGIPTPTADFIANLKTLAAAVPTAVFIVVSPIPCQIDSEYQLGRDYAIHERYELPYPMVDLGQHFGTWAEADAMGWMGDVRHQSTLGMQKQAELYDQMLALA